MNAIFLGCAMLLAPAAEPVKRAEGAKPDPEQLLGAWVDAGFYLDDGKKRDPNPEQAGDPYLLFVGDRFVYGLNAGTFAVGKEGELDLLFTAGENKGATAKCRYAVDGDRLTIAHPTGFRAGAARPAHLRTDAPAREVTVALFTRHKTITMGRMTERMKFLTGYADAFSPRKTTPELLMEVLDRLERIEKRLDAIEKRQAEKK